MMFEFGALRAKLIVVFALILALTIGTTVSRSLQLNRIEQAEASKSELADPYDHALADAANSAKSAAHAARGYLLTGQQRFVDDFDTIHVPKVLASLALAEGLYGPDSIESHFVVHIGGDMKEWVSLTRRVFELYAVDPSGAIKASLEVNAPLREHYEALIETANELSHHNVELADATFNTQLRSARVLGTVIAIGSILTALLLALWIVRTMLVEHRRVTEIIEAEAGTSTFAHELGEAMEMAENSDEAVEVVKNALAYELTGSTSQLLLSDSSEVNLEVVATHPDNPAWMCGVSTLWACPAIRRGRIQITSSSHALDACPKLRENGGDPCSAVCSPVMFMGKPLGVLHSISDPDHDWESKDADRLNEICGTVGNRIGVLKVLEQTKRQAATDALTGLANRRTLEDEISKLLRNGTRCVIAMCDLDEFKQINDTFGHDIGDRSLRRFARVLNDVTRAEDLVARYGGDEFVIVFPNLSETDAVSALERVRENLSISSTDGRTPGFTASFGVCGSDDASNLEEAIEKADEALRKAKRAGRNRVVSVSQSQLDSPSHLS